MVEDFRRRGIGRQLAEHSLLEARRLGFDAMLFNLVLERNPSKRLWESLGFSQIGRLPDVVGGEAALVYWRSLEEPLACQQHRQGAHVQIRPAAAEDAKAIAAIFN